MQTSFASSLRRPGLLVGVLLVLASVALTLGFACALPLAAFATASAMLFSRRAAVAAVLAVWLANQVVGFACLHYPADASTFAWGGALGVIALASLAVARGVLERLPGVVGPAVAFVSAFVAYEGSVYLACLASGTDVSHFTVSDVTRVFLVNATAFAGFVAVRALVLQTRFGRELDARPAIPQA